jgi:protein-S-isoprenylcysteine O-methyltransferase
MTAQMEGDYQQSFDGVRITYSAEHVAHPLEDYVRLLSKSSVRVSQGAPQFTSRVGLARVALLGGGLGVIFGVHLTLLAFTFSYPSPVTNWCIYALVMCLYHWSEFLLTALNHPQNVSFDSFLVNQSLAFGIAIVASWIEFGLEAFLIPAMKCSTTLTTLGLMVVLCGQMLRSLAMYQAGPSFTHLVESEKKPRHILIKWGVYKYLRHPGYFGWFYWSVGTQLLLGNPLCVIAYVLAAQSFFRERVPDEEENLLVSLGPNTRNT